MSLLFKVIFKTKTTSTHHKIALDALRHLNNPNAEKWKNLFLRYNDKYLEGAKDPDKKFHDFKNHVIHTEEGFWGGAPTAATLYYEKFVSLLKEKKWDVAIYSAGVLSHYFSDPIQPLHTGQEEAEGKIHKIYEWAVSKTYDDLIQILEQELGGYPQAEIPSSDNWLEEMIKEGATVSHKYYDTIIDHYDFEKGVKNPADGMDETLNKLTAQLLGYAVVGFAAVLDKAFEEAGVTPPEKSLTLKGFIESLKIPIYWVLRKLEDSKDKKAVKAIYEEVQEKGKAIESLPPDDKEVRRLHAIEVLKIPLEELDKKPARPTGTKHGQKEEVTPFKSRKEKQPKETIEKQRVEETKTEETPQKKQEKEKTKTIKEEKEKPKKLRWYLELSDPVEDAPSIGKKTASYLNNAGIKTIKDLLEADPEELAEKLNKRWIKPETIKIWQTQAKLVCQIPGLRGHDAKILANSGITTPEQMTNYSPNELLEKISEFVNSKEGERALRGGKKPDLEEVTYWIEMAKNSRKLQ